VVADSLSQCVERGEIVPCTALALPAPRRRRGTGRGDRRDVPGRLSEEDITVADLTGVAVQDIEIAGPYWTRSPRREAVDVGNGVFG